MDEITKKMDKNLLVEEFFTHSLDLLCIADFEGNFVKLNPAWEDVLGYPLADLQGKPFAGFIHPEDQPATMIEVGKLMGGSKTVNFENRFVCKDGSYRNFLIA